MKQQTYTRGVIYVLLAGIFLSTGGLLVRNVDAADPWTVLFYRSLTFSITVFIFIVIQHRKQTWHLYQQMRWSDALVSVSLAVGFISYLLSLFNTSVANTVLILSTGPFLAALLAWLVLGERVSRPTILAMLMATAGVVVMVSGGLNGSDITGVSYAVIAVLAFAVMVVTLRRIGPQRDTLAAVSLAGFTAAALCLFFIPTFTISAHDLWIAICLGSLQVGFGFILITLGTRSVPAAQVPLLALGETALAPIWVWLFVNETPAANTLLGGTLVLTAVLFQGVMGIRSNRG